MPFKIHRRLRDGRPERHCLDGRGASSSPQRVMWHSPKNTNRKSAKDSRSLRTACVREMYCATSPDSPCNARWRVRFASSLEYRTPVIQGQIANLLPKATHGIGCPMSATLDLPPTKTRVAMTILALEVIYDLTHPIIISTIIIITTTRHVSVQLCLSDRSCFCGVEKPDGQSLPTRIFSS